jgi:hypothetical protein
MDEIGALVAKSLELRANAEAAHRRADKVRSGMRKIGFWYLYCSSSVVSIASASAALRTALSTSNVLARKLSAAPKFSCIDSPCNCKLPDL